MCLYERDIFLLGMLFALQLAEICFLFATPEGRAALAGLDLRSVRKPLARALLYAIPAAALIKLAHDWVGSDGKSLCMSRAAYLLACFLLCAALELRSFASEPVDTGSDLALSTRYPVRWWGLLVLVGAVLVTLLSNLAFK